MPKIAYKEVNFRADSLALIGTAEHIVREYEADGYDLTLRQLYYQLVARGYIENNINSYKRVGSIINDARLAGYIDWNSIADRTRNMQKNNHWSSPGEIIRAACNQYRINTRADQPNYIEVWVEKEALVDVVAKACRPLDVPFFACRGYVSQSEMWAAAMRFKEKAREGKEPHIIHLGDHDPSGVDMTRDISERMDLFEAYTEVHRIALNFDQIIEFSPPPNPAKITDSRAGSYIRTYGEDSWELDALKPSVITDIITEAVDSLTDMSAWYALQEEEAEERKRIKKYADMADE